MYIYMYKGIEKRSKFIVILYIMIFGAIKTRLPKIKKMRKKEKPLYIPYTVVAFYKGKISDGRINQDMLDIHLLTISYPFLYNQISNSLLDLWDPTWVIQIKW
jgi:hypothetical protein